MIIDLNDGVLIEGNEVELRSTIDDIEHALEHGECESCMVNDDGVIRFKVRLVADADA